LVAITVVPVGSGIIPKVARKQRREAGHEHPAARHHALVLLPRELADHRIADRHYVQLTDALQHGAGE
jgi:hypothetical protein